MIWEEKPQKVHMWKDQSHKPFRRSRQVPVNSLCHGNWNESTTLYTTDPVEVTCKLCLNMMRVPVRSGRWSSRDPAFSNRPKRGRTSDSLGIQLLTKDGRQIGNAVITGIDVTEERIYEPVFLVTTDFGNKMGLTEDEINTLWHPGKAVSLDRWFEDRRKLVNGDD